MIRLGGSLGAALAEMQARHDHLLGRIGRIVGAVLTLVALAVWAAALVGLVPAVAQLVGLAQIVVGLAILGGMRELQAHTQLRELAPAVPLSELARAPDWLRTTNLAEYVSAPLASCLCAAVQHETLDGRTFVTALLQHRTVALLMARAGVVGTAQPALGVPGEAAGGVTSVDALLQYAAVEAVAEGHQRIDLAHVLLVLADHHPAVSALLGAHGVTRDDILATTRWYERTLAATEHQFFWERGKVGIWGIGRDWAAGYTPTLSRFAVDLSRYLGDRSLQLAIVGRGREIEQLVLALSSARHANALLVGRPGVGKKTLVNGLAARIASGAVPPFLSGKHVFELDVNQLLAAAQTPDAVEALVLRILRDAEHAGNIILFINDLHVLTSASAGTVGRINASEVLLPFLQSGRIQLIGATTPHEFHAALAPQSGVAQLLVRIDVAEPSEAEAAEMIERAALALEVRANVFFTMPVLRRVVTQASRYLTDVPRPESALRLLESIAIQAGNSGTRLVTLRDVDVAVSTMSKVPVGEAAQDEKSQLLQLEQLLHERVIGQDEAVVAVASALRRARSGLGAKNRPVGSFLFLGPTGVGKTETAKALAAAYFGDEQAMVRLDMSEFQSPASLARLIGAPTEVQAAGSGELIQAVRDKPFSLILLDELEKAHPDVRNVFLQILEDGRVTDGRGEPCDFTHTHIIATSNAGSELIREAIQTGTDHEVLKAQLLESLQRQGVFTPEFLNRFDAVVAFRPLTPAELGQIIELQLAGLNERLAEQQVSVVLTSAARERIAQLGYQPEFGARPLRRVLQDRVENLVADKLLKGELQRGQILTIDKSDLS